MDATAEWEEVVFTTTSRKGICHQVVRRPNGTCTIRIGGETVHSLYWRAGELDRCMRALEEIMAADEQNMPAAA